MRISTVAAFVLAISVAMVIAIPMKKEGNREVDRGGPARSDVVAMADQATDIRGKRYSWCRTKYQSCDPNNECCGFRLACTRGRCEPKPCTPKGGACSTSVECCGRLVCFHSAQSWKGSFCGER